MASYIIVGKFIDETRVAILGRSLLPPQLTSSVTDLRIPGYMGNDNRALPSMRGS